MNKKICLVCNSPTSLDTCGYIKYDDHYCINDIGNHFFLERYLNGKVVKSKTRITENNTNYSIILHHDKNYSIISIIDLLHKSIRLETIINFQPSTLVKKVKNVFLFS